MKGSHALQQLQSHIAAAKTTVRVGKSMHMVVTPEAFSIFNKVKGKPADLLCGRQLHRATTPAAFSCRGNKL